MDDKPVFVISIAAELSNMHPQTLRIYERKGLLKPKRSIGKTRLYSEKDVAMLKEIQFLTQETGINLAGVKKIFDLREELDQAQEKLDMAKQEMERVKEQARKELLEIMRANSPQIVLSESRSIANFIKKNMESVFDAEIE